MAALRLGDPAEVCVNVLSLFAGIGGLDLGLEWAGFRTVAFVERDPACQHWLGQHWPGVPIHGDIHTFSGVSLRGSVDLVCGGFPCQPFSVAGKQKGTEDERHLWPEMSRIIREVRPRFVLAENVPGLRTIAADLVLEDLEGQGYTCWPLVVGVDDVGGPHRRKRVWIVARKLDHPDAGRREQAIWRRPEGNSRQGRDILPKAEESTSLAYRDGGGCEGERIEERESEHEGAPRRLADGCDPAAMADTAGRGLGTDGGPSRDAGHPDICEPPVGEPTGAGLEGQRPDAGEPQEPEPRHAMRWPSRPGEPQHPWEAPRLAHTHSTRRAKSGSGHSLDAGREPQSGCGEGMGDPSGSRRSAGGCVTGWEIRDEARRPESERRDGSDGMADSSSEPSRSPGQPRQGTDPRESQSPMGGAVDGLPDGLAGLTSAHRRESLKALGNAVSPPCAYYLGRAIMSMAEASE